MQVRGTRATAANPNPHLPLSKGFSLSHGFLPLLQIWLLSLKFKTRI